jgi:hypothetical protein
MKKCYIESKEVRSIIHAVNRRKPKWIGHILHRNCLLKLNAEGNTKKGPER